MRAEITSFSSRQSLNVEEAFIEMLIQIQKYALEESYYAKLCEMNLHNKTAFSRAEKTKILFEVRPQISCARNQINQAMQNVKKLHS